VADAARAAKEKKQKQTGAAQSSDAPAKTKVITNDEIPESNSDSQPAPSKSSSASPSQNSVSSSNPSGSQAPQDGLPHGPDSASIDFKFTTNHLKRPAKADTLWMLKNTSDHRERINLRVVMAGPCGYHYQHENGSDFNPGQALTDNFDVDLTILATDCAGTYHVSLEAVVAAKVLASASDFITAE